MFYVIKFYLCIYKGEFGTWHYGLSLPVSDSFMYLLTKVNELLFAFVILLDIVKAWMDNYQKYSRGAITVNIESCSQQ